MHDIVLDGCRPTPLAHYLKALGVLRLVSEQKDPTARGFWRNDRFVLRTTLSEEELERFFLEEYRPTPIVAPWNGGSGFYPKDNKTAIKLIETCTASRFESFRHTIVQVTALLQELGFSEKVGPEEKLMLLQGCRARLSDEVLPWLDAVYVLAGDSAKYPPLLGTGGNDGRLEFTNNFMQRLLTLIDPETGAPKTESKQLIRGALMGVPTSGLVKGAPIGQFLPQDAGGANRSMGYSSDSLINPWDFVLMIEGATAFAAATVRRTELDTNGAMSAPFTVRSIGVGYGSSSASDENNSRAELWLPIWERTSSFRELQSLLAEGRIRLGRRQARNGVDFARAVASLGVDRGIAKFERFGFHVRNGLAYFAIPLGQFAVKAQSNVELLNEIDAWLDRFRGSAKAQNAPAAAERSLRNLEAGIFDLCVHGDAPRTQKILNALGQCERTMVKSQRWTTDKYLHPLPPLNPRWLKESDDGSPEYRLAASLASVVGNFGTSDKPVHLRIRSHFEPIRLWKTEHGLRLDWAPESEADVVWTPGHLITSLNRIMERRLMLATQTGAGTYPDTGYPHTSPGDIADFIEGRVDESKLIELLQGLLLIDWTRVRAEHLPQPRPRARSPMPGAFYSLLKLCFLGPTRSGSRATYQTDANADARSASLSEERWSIPVTPGVHRLAASGRGEPAINEALRRLRGSGYAPALRDCAASSVTAARSAAALLFPLSHFDQQLLRQRLLRPDQQPDSRETDNSTLAISQGVNS